MLCNVCSRINLDELVSEEGMKHHENFIDLINAAKAGCPLCDAVFEYHDANYGSSEEDFVEDHEGIYLDYEEDHEANFDNYEDEVVDYAGEESGLDVTDLEPERAQIVCKVDWGYPISTVVKFRQPGRRGVRHALNVILGCCTDSGNPSYYQ
jgi:hypothetical protein